MTKKDVPAYLAWSVDLADLSNSPSRKAQVRLEMSLSYDLTLLPLYDICRVDRRDEILSLHDFPLKAFP